MNGIIAIRTYLSSVVRIFFSSGPVLCEILLREKKICAIDDNYMVP